MYVHSSIASLAHLIAFEFHLNQWHFASYVPAERQTMTLIMVREHLLCTYVFTAVVPNRRRIIGNHYLRYVNVTKSDAQVLQCNVSNKHGYIFANAYLNVLGKRQSVFAYTVYAV
jgi:hypothetical protein